MTISLGLALRWGLDSGGAPASALLLMGAAALILLTVALAYQRPGGVVWSLAVLGGEYVVWLAAGSRKVDAAAPIIAALLIAVAELAYESLELREVEAVETAVVARLMARVAIAVVAGAAVAAALLLAGGLKLSTGLGFEVIGLASAAAAMALIARLATRTAAERRSPGVDGTR